MDESQGTESKLIVADGDTEELFEFEEEGSARWRFL